MKAEGETRHSRCLTTCGSERKMSVEISLYLILTLSLLYCTAR
jgi:hypothetical protein